MAWFLFRYIEDPCYRLDHDRSPMISFLAAWLFVFLMGNKYIKIALGAVTFFVLFFVPLAPGNVHSTATSLAASTLRATREKLEAEHAQKEARSYRATVTFVADKTSKMFYRFEYVPLTSKSSGDIDGYILKARPLRYGCGITRSFLFDKNGKFHTIQEDREPTENDPILE